MFKTGLILILIFWFFGGVFCGLIGWFVTVSIKSSKNDKSREYQIGYSQGYSDGNADKDECISTSYYNGWRDCENYYKEHEK